MRKLAIIVGIFLMLFFAAVWTFFTVRQYKIDQQYVSNLSTSILSMAIDDLLLDNLWYFSAGTNDSGGTENRNNHIKNLIFDAGIAIPARIFLFSTPQDTQTLFGILKINNFDKCFSFFAKNYPSKIKFIDRQKSIVSVNLNNGFRMIFNNEYLIYQIGLDENADFSKLQTLLKQRDSWSQIGNLEGFKDLLSDEHLSYQQKNDRLQIQATVKKNHITLNGVWRLNEDLDEKFLVRDMDTLKQTVTFWSVLPLQEAPILARVIQKYTGLDAQQLGTSYQNYVDLQVNNDSVAQIDSSIIYAYDDEFNPIEEVQVQQQQVPSILHAWKSDSTLQVALPDKMFYSFHKKDMGEYFISTTLDSFPPQTSSKQTPYAVYCYVDFKTWPEQWTIPLLRIFKEQNMQTRFVAQRQDRRTLLIEGDIRLQTDN